MKLVRPLVVLDLETTGTWVQKDRIIEIGMIRYQTNGKKETYVKRVNPQMRIPMLVQRLTGIRDEDVAQAPVFDQLADEILSFIGDADLGGFNVERFDLPVLEREMYEAGRRFQWQDRQIFDAQKVYHYHEKRDLKAAYAFYCGKELQNAHSALGDSEATLEILQKQIEKYAPGRSEISALKDYTTDDRPFFYDKTKRFRWWNGELYPMFGKYARKKSMKSIAEKDRGYLEWILRQDFSDEVKKLVEDVLNGKFPKSD